MESNLEALWELYSHGELRFPRKVFVVIRFNKDSWVSRFVLLKFSTGASYVAWVQLRSSGLFRKRCRKV